MIPFSKTTLFEEGIATRYPRQIQTRDQTSLTLTPMVASDWQLLEQFLSETPPDERRYFRHDTSDPDRVRRWCSQLDYRHSLPLLAWSGDRIVADGVLQRTPGLWTSHVGNARLLVAPEFRRRGVGTELLREMILVGAEFDLQKLTYECAADQAELIGFLQTLDFREAARLPEFIRDCRGQLHEMVLLVRDLS